MKKLTAAVCAMVIALSMAGCGSGDSADEAADDTSLAMGDKETNLENTYKLKFTSYGDIKTDRAHVDEYVEISEKQAHSLIDNDYEAFKEAMNFDLVKELSPSREDSDVRDSFDEFRGEFESAGITDEILSRELTNVYVQEIQLDPVGRYTYCTYGTIALVYMGESGEKGKYIEFDVGNYDEELTVFFREARDTSKEELDEKDSYFDNFYNDSEN